MWDSRYLKAGLIVACLLAALWYTHGIYDILRQSSFTDFGVFFHAGDRLRKGEPMYDADGMRAFTFGPQYKYPPFWASLLQFIAPFEFRKVAIAWLFLSQVFYFGSFALLCRLFGFRFHSSEFYILLFAFLFFQPTLDSMNGPQMDALFLFILTLSWWGLARGRESVSGAAIGFMAAIKITPGFMGLHFLVRRKWPALVSLLISYLLLMVGSLLLAGWDAHREYLFNALPASIGTTAYIENQSLFGFVARFFVEGTSYEAGKATVLPIAKWITVLVSTFILSASIYFGWKSRHEDAVYASWITVLLLLLPFSWTHYELILLFPIAVLFFHQRTAEKDLKGWVLLGLAYLLLAYGTPETLRAPAYFAHSYKFYAVLLLWVSLAVTANSSSHSQSNANKDIEKKGTGTTARHLERLTSRSI